MLEHLKPLVHWLHLHPEWSGVATFLIALLESVAILGSFIPGSVMMTAIGALVGSGVIPIWGTFAWAIAGAFIGDTGSYAIGYHYKESLLQRWPFKRFPKLIHTGEDFIKKHGGKSIFIGRFFGPTRAITPITAGMLSMRPVRFLLLTLIVCILWAPVYMAAGILVGAASLALPPKMALHFITYLVLILFIIGLTAWSFNYISFKIKNIYVSILNITWRGMKKRKSFHGFVNFLENPQRPHYHGQLSLGLLFILFSSFFIYLLFNIIHQGPLTQFNLPLMHFMRSFHSLLGEKIAIGITLLGQKQILAFVIPVIFLWLLCRKKYWAAFHWAGVNFITVGIAYVLKKVIVSPRPTGLVFTQHNWSFPSGHTTLAMVAFGFLAVLIAQEIPWRKRWRVHVTAAILILAVGISRLYLTAHWLTDIIGAYTLGLSGVMLFAISYRRKPIVPVSPFKLMLVAILAWGIGIGYYGVKHFHKYTHQYNIKKIHHTQNYSQWENQTAPITLPVRKDRLGYLNQVMTIQYAGSLAQLENKLLKHHWHLARERIIHNLIKLFSEKVAYHLPIFAEQYLNQPPKLILIKHNKHTKKLLILRIWDAHTTLEPNKTKLYYGTVLYQQPFHLAHLFHHYHKINLDQTIAQRELIKDLIGFKIKTIHTQHMFEFKDGKVPWSGMVVLVGKN